MSPTNYLHTPAKASSPDMPQMELYAAGFNAWNQLRLDGNRTGAEPDDVFAFTCVLRDAASITDLRPRLSYTVGEGCPCARR